MVLWNHKIRQDRKRWANEGPNRWGIPPTENSAGETRSGTANSGLNHRLRIKDEIARTACFCLRGHRQLCQLGKGKSLERNIEDAIEMQDKPDKESLKAMSKSAFKDSAALKRMRSDPFNQKDMARRKKGS